MYAVMRCFRIVMVTDFSACFSPYQSETDSISTIGVSITGRDPVRTAAPRSRAEAPIRTLVAMVTPLGMIAPGTCIVK
jgi:hypothetical protein